MRNGYFIGTDGHEGFSELVESLYCIIRHHTGIRNICRIKPLVGISKCSCHFYCNNNNNVTSCPIFGAKPSCT